MASSSAVKKLRKSKSVCATDTECGKKVGKWLDECDSDDDITEDGSVFSDDSDEQLLLKLTVVGTLRMNKPEIPIQFLANKGREVLSSEFAFKDYTTLVSYVPKKNKAVVLLSAMHHDKSIDSQSPKKKPEIILQYNKTKGGVDLMDQKFEHTQQKESLKDGPITNA
ncbi:hypothetical protein ANN_23222 [Periplaneta americana]|uniref:PiggyBac transposable element-derived protein domain-containing protein n=1 Tax=Periplaneta americana TaxID=6978 RepID=A0ABQ8SLR8_PERAM|nr:hypothetical protein ANN_23222 [Periplaneta americana]